MGGLQLERRKGLVFDIKRDCSEDGPGIRSVVFLKGCPLSCIWCHNPEGISQKPSLSYTTDRCKPMECGGYPCLEICCSNALKIDNANKKIQVDRSACTRCDKCFEVCKPKALEPVGNWWGTKQLVKRVLVDRKYFRSTGGGVTVSGGEPTLQMEFLHDFLLELKKEDINIGLETSGMFELNRFQELVLPCLDFVYFDLKLISPEASRKYTGHSNKNIIRNFLTLHYESSIPIIPRVPLVPDITTTRENLVGIKRFLQRHGIKACSLIPYNPIWHEKATRNGLTIQYFHNEFMSKSEEEKCMRYFTQAIIFRPKE